MPVSIHSTLPESARVSRTGDQTLGNGSVSTSNCPAGDTISNSGSANCIWSLTSRGRDHAPTEATGEITVSTGSSVGGFGVKGALSVTSHCRHATGLRRIYPDLRRYDSAAVGTASLVARGQCHHGCPFRGGADERPGTPEIAFRYLAYQRHERAAEAYARMRNLGAALAEHRIALRALRFE